MVIRSIKMSCNYFTAAEVAKLGELREQVLVFLSVVFRVWVRPLISFALLYNPVISFSTKMEKYLKFLGQVTICTSKMLNEGGGLLSWEYVCYGCTLKGK